MWLSFQGSKVSVLTFLSTVLEVFQICHLAKKCVKKYFDKIGEVLRNVLKNIVTKSYKICDVGWSRFATSYLNAKSWISL